MNETTSTAPQRSRSTLWLLISITVLPFVAAYIYYNFGDFKTFSNNGDLINPVIDIQALKLSDDTGQALERESLTKKWRMFLIVGENCDEACQSSLFVMRQLNVALGKNYDRFRHMLIHTAPMSIELAELIHTEYKDALHAYSDNDVLSAALKPADEKPYSNSILIMDPIGNIMMRFKADMNPKIILRDLNRLLKISQIG